jgi:nucleoside-diphosphate-sugar epimerase
VKVLVTGATGFVGRRLVELLVRKGDRVKALVRQISDSSPLRSAGAEIVQGDIRDPAAMNEAVANTDCVYHLAAKTTKHELSKREYYAHNVDGTKNIALAAIKFGVKRLVYASSVGVYGTNRNLAIDETTVPRPNSYYRESKLIGEQELLSLYESHGLPVVIARLGTTFGPGSRTFVDLSRKITAGNFRIAGQGENHDQMVYVEDLVKGLKRCGEVQGIEGRTYVLAGDKPATSRELLGLLAGELGVPPEFGHLPAAPFQIYGTLASSVYRLIGFQIPKSNYYNLFLSDHIYNISRARNELGYLPITSLKEGLHKLIAWYRAQKYLAR